MKPVIAVALILFSLLVLSSCSLVDISGLVHSGDVDDRFTESALLPDKSNLSFSETVFSFIVITDTHVEHASQANLAALKGQSPSGRQVYFNLWRYSPMWIFGRLSGVL